MQKLDTKARYYGTGGIQIEGHFSGSIDTSGPVVVSGNMSGYINNTGGGFVGGDLTGTFDTTGTVVVVGTIKGKIVGGCAKTIQEAADEIATNLEKQAAKLLKRATEIREDQRSAVDEIKKRLSGESQ
jgi:cytoskeletal protein CcmA (bactofilin family)